MIKLLAKLSGVGTLVPNKMRLKPSSPKCEVTMEHKL